MVSTYPPRRCAVASFTQQLRSAVAQVAPGWQIDVVALDQGNAGYGPEVVARIDPQDVRAYQRAARLIAGWGADLVVIQHDFRIFGGDEGAHVLELANVLRRHAVPYAVTLHAVLSTHTAGQAAVLHGLCRDAERITVFTPGTQRLLAGSGLVDPSRVSVVPHGAPAVLRTPNRAPGHPPVLAKAVPPFSGIPMLTTFGLIGPGKGLEQVIAALPAIVARHPGTRYVIAGATHPDVLRTSGEAYRRQLAGLAERLHVAEHVRFVDAYLSESELAALLARTTIYLTPYRDFDHVCSGALSSALVAGCPVVSTPYRFAVEMLNPPGVAPAGVLVPPDEPVALATAVGDLLDDPARLASMRTAARAVGAHLEWPSVASRFVRVFGATIAATAGTTSVPVRTATRALPIGPAGVAPPGGAAQPLAAGQPILTRQPPDGWSSPGRYEHRMDHLDRLTDLTGIVACGRGARADTSSGYRVDDAARLAVVATQLRRPGDPRPRQWLRTALHMLNTAAFPGGMHNVMGPDRAWRDLPHLGDHVGRAVWAAGTVAGTQDQVGGLHRTIARQLLRNLAPLVPELNSPLALAYAVLGLAQATTTAPTCRTALREAAGRLDSMIEENPAWHWYEPELRGDNARLPQALLAAAVRLGNPDWAGHALSTLDWYLARVGLAGGQPRLHCVAGRQIDGDRRSVGAGKPSGGRRRVVADSDSGGAGQPSAERPEPPESGDEQPLDAAALVVALVAAWQVTGQPRYPRLARIAFGWFHGDNRAGLPVYDASTGGCRDRLCSGSVFVNQGAAATLAYHEALAAMRGARLIDSCDGGDFCASAGNAGVLPA